MHRLEEWIEIGLGHHRAGRLAEAEQVYRQILAAHPRAAQARHLLGLAVSQSGRFQCAVDEIRRAIALDDSQAVFHANLGEAYRGLGDLEKAVECYRQALRLTPEFAAAHNNLGTVLHAQGRIDEAAAAYRRALAIQPNYADAHNNLGAVLEEQGHSDAAIELFERAIAIDPQYSRAHYNLGLAWQARQQTERAVAALERAIALDEGYVDARYALARLWQQAGQLDQAEVELQQVLRQRPSFAAVHNSLGVLYQAQGKLAAAIDCYRQSLAIEPDAAEVHYNLGTALEAQVLLEPAAAEYRRAIECQRDFAGAYYNLGVVLRKLGRLDEGVAAYECAVLARSDFSLAYNNLANAYLDQGRGDDAIACYRAAVASDPNSAFVYSNLLYTLNYVPGREQQATFDEHRAWARRHAEPLTAQALPHPVDRDPERRLRIGYVSPHFCRHAVSPFIEPILAAHDRAQFEVYCYSDLRIEPDATTARLETAADHWRSVGGMSDLEIDRLVRDDRIDILVDLTGHVGGNRLLVFARKPAPLQVTYLGYQNTTGMSAIDYRLTDAHADPPGEADRLHTEELIRLPDCFFCYRAPDDAPSVTPLPALISAAVTFGSFNSFAKVTPQTIDAWIEILARTPRSRLLVLAYRGGYVERLLVRAARERGVDAARVELADRRAPADYLRLVQQADIALDPLGFNGHTTTCDAIWMGVPVVMLEGNCYASRFGTSVLANVRLDDWIARSREEYVALAVEKASDLTHLAALRAELRPRMAASPVLDFAGFTRKLEQAYRTMWAGRCRST